MYPPDQRRALLVQLETERAISDLVALALELWLPLAEQATLRAAAEPPPDPSAAADVEPQWNYLMDAVILYGIGMLAADAADAGYTALAGVPMAAGEASFHTALLFDMPGLPSVSELRQRANAVLKRTAHIDTDRVANRLSTVPRLRQFAMDHVAAVRGRVLDAVGRVFRKLRANNDALPVEEARAEVRSDLDPEQWQAAADEVGQTQATAALNAGADIAAGMAIADHGLQINVEWVAILDSHTRIAHEEADGQVVPMGTAFTVGGEELRFPGDPAGSIDNTINCRCRIFASVVRDGLRADGSPSHVPAIMADDTKEISTMGKFRSFTSVLAVIGEETDDGRMFAPEIDLSFRDFPLPLMWQKQSAGGHFDAFTVGVIEGAGVVGSQVIGNGYMLDTPEAADAMTEIEHQVTGPSVDLGSVEWELRDENGKPISEEDWWDMPIDAKVVQTVLAAKVLAATLVSTPAFGSTNIELGEWVERGQDALVAAAAMATVGYKGVPTYPAEHFGNPEFEGPTLPHITEDGRIQGHLAAFNTCHVGIQDSCVMAPRSQTDYAWFHTAPPARTDTGTFVKVGRLTVGGGHADQKLTAGPAIAHYDDAGTCFALVHVGEDEHGIWFSGVPAPGATDEQIAAGLAAPLSGDWRNVGGNLELVAALAVNTPGFPILASGATNERDEPLSLVASLGPCQTEEPVTGINLKDYAREVVAELRAAEHRDKEAARLVAQVVKQEAMALIARVVAEGGQ